MPHFRLETNVPADKIPKKFLQETTGVLAKALGKPQSYCVATVAPGAMMCWGGDDSDKPCGTATLMSIGQLGVEKNKKIAAVLFDHIQKHLGIPQDRLYITFQDAPSSDVGYNGTTFHAIFG